MWKYRNISNKSKNTYTKACGSDIKCQCLQQKDNPLVSRLINVLLLILQMIWSGQRSNAYYYYDFRVSCLFSMHKNSVALKEYWKVTPIKSCKRTKLKHAKELPVFIEMLKIHLKIHGQEKSTFFLQELICPKPTQDSIFR